LGSTMVNNKVPSSIGYFFITPPSTHTGALLYQTVDVSDSGSIIDDEIWFLGENPLNV
jgi:hypothetical protein